MSTALDIQHHPERQRFSTEPRPGLHGELDYQRRGEQLLITHTGVDPALRGQGVAAQLVEAALAWLAPQGLQLVPACSYVQLHLRRHAHWQRLLAPAAAQAVLNEWFGAPGSAEDGQIQAKWFRKNPDFDRQLQQRFGAGIDDALAGGLRDWDDTPWGLLARVLLLDQFTRNTGRDTPRAFAGDALALEAALALIPRWQDLGPLQRWFALMPLEHAEDAALQARCVREFEALAAQDARLADALDYARRHEAVIRRFGRFPHRNAILGRESTAEERDYLAQPGAGF